MSSDYPFREFQITELLRGEWNADPSNQSVWISAFRIAGISPETLSNGFITIDFEAIRIIMLYGQMSYLNSQELIVEVGSNNDIKIQGNTDVNKTSLGGLSIFITPYSFDNPARTESQVKFEVTAAAGYLAAMCGANMVYSHLFDNIIQLNTNQLTGTSPIIINPTTLTGPYTSTDYISTANLGTKNLYNLSEEKRNKIRLSLHWMELAFRDLGVDKLLKIWIAIEVLAMSDTNIRPINEALASIYSIPIQEARNAFGIGRLFSLRSRIVHRGHLPPLHYLLTDYMEAIYTDLLFKELGLQSRHRALSFINSSSFNLNKLIPDY